MKVLGIEIPPADELMPGPIDARGVRGRAAPAEAKSASNGASANGSGDLDGRRHELGRPERRLRRSQQA
jgi:hypothetical protein